tara:strand:+ start:596 stop:1036 length:441 start_codon:yes stop_codon:yes gene_type:complete
MKFNELSTLIEEGSIKDYMKSKVDSHIIKKAKKRGDWVRDELVSYSELDQQEVRKLHHRINSNNKAPFGLGRDPRTIVKKELAKRGGFFQALIEDLPLYYGVEINTDKELNKFEYDYMNHIGDTQFAASKGFPSDAISKRVRNRLS